MSELEQIWRSKSDEEVINAMLDSEGYLPEALAVIQNEVERRGLSVSLDNVAAFVKEEESQNQPKKPVVFSVILGLLFGFMSISLFMKSGDLFTAGDLGDIQSVKVALASAFAVVLSIWSLACAIYSFKRTYLGWLLIVMFATYTVVSSTTTIVIEILTETVASTLSLWGSLIWAVILYAVYRPGYKQLMNVDADDSSGASTVLAWVVGLTIVVTLYMNS